MGVMYLFGRFVLSALPFSSKPFMLTMLVIVLHTFCTNVPASFVNYYLLNNVGVQYTYIYAINMVYPFMLLFLQPIARKLINRFGWFKVLAVSMFIHAPSWVAYACVTGGNLSVGAGARGLRCHGYWRR